LRLGIWPGQPDRTARRAGRSRSVAVLHGAAHPQEVPGEATRQVEEMEVGNLARQAPDLAGEGREHRASQRGLGIDEAIERVAPEDERFDGPDGDRRGRARSTIEQRELTEEPAPSDGREDHGFGALLRRQDDLDLTRSHNEQGIAWVLDVEEDLATAE